jgi:hypothetical protein
MPRKSQSSLEFTVIISFMFIVFLSFFYVIGNRLVQIKEDNDRMLLEDFGDYLKNEIGFASASVDGYERSFEVPSTLSGRNYHIKINDYSMVGINHTELELSFENYSIEYNYVVLLPLRTRGGVDQKKNPTIVIKKANNVVYLDTFPIECGDGLVGSTEDCEGQQNNNIYCKQSTTECVGNRTKTRDSLGMCDNDDCSCVEDLFSNPECVQGSCNALCGQDSDCTYPMICSPVSCACITL